MKRISKFTAACCFLLLIFLCCTVGIARTLRKEEARGREEYYRQLEQAYVEQLREYLNEAGYLNSGIMLTRTVTENGSREYQIAIHNSGFDRLSEEEMQSLLKELAAGVFVEENCSFQHLLTGNA